ncbi:hypothetical protein F1559_003581 [Cyanidiococcus yangmingshanensis]|uniref:Uncharacterized protein n=1 Tax=Cyanidiococcus yangmingshanensis TaxID=2690220 RepID=A0A7J7ILK1_9RHOD|nr:hypothetical protein F1559_003581 [Cyanidiococcus yangmingshanensis]
MSADELQVRDWVAAVEAATAQEERRWRRLLKWFQAPHWFMDVPNGDRVCCRWDSSSSGSFTESNYESDVSSVSDSLSGEFAVSVQAQSDLDAASSKGSGDIGQHNDVRPTRRLRRTVQALLDSDNVSLEPVESITVQHCLQHISEDAARIAAMYVPPVLTTNEAHEPDSREDVQGYEKGRDWTDSSDVERIDVQAGLHARGTHNQAGDIAHAIIDDTCVREEGGATLSAPTQAHDPNADTVIQNWREQAMAFRDAAELADLELAQGEALELALQRFEERMQRLVEAVGEAWHKLGPPAPTRS